jgi:hypothetical protein
MWSVTKMTKTDQESIGGPSFPPILTIIVVSRLFLERHFYVTARCAVVVCSEMRLR